MVDVFWYCLWLVCVIFLFRISDQILGYADPSFDFKTLVIVLGVINGTTYAGGAYFGAKLADLWGAKTIRAYGWLPAIAIAICLPIGVMSFWVSSVWIHLVFTTFLLLFLGIYLGPSFAIAQTLAPVNICLLYTSPSPRDS